MVTLDQTIRQILALPREAGTPEAELAREHVTRYLSDLGYKVQVQTFTFTPASLRAFPVFGAGLGGLALILLPFLASAHLPAWAPLVLWMSGLLALAVVAGGIGLGWVPLGEALREDANLMATRGGTPRRWIVAHLDSKAQGHSMAGRLVAVWTVGLAIVALSLLTLSRLWGPLAPVWLAIGAGLAVVAGVLAGKGRLRGRSLGARDNGTGIVAALAAAEACSDPSVGILITGAEEFGLVGARVFARLTGDLQEIEFINIDTVDQEGCLYLVSHNSAGERLARHLEPVLSALDVPLKHRRLPVGIFVDSAPLARAHAPAITIGRLTWATLRRIHTPEDTPHGLSLDTAYRVGKAIVSN
ncbi:MAG TPA: M28 family peptidase [Gemmatimonadales bacterium]|nr:M28 family peptidase [Gemmatimonadales bacterium]